MHCRFGPRSNAGANMRFRSVWAAVFATGVGLQRAAARPSMSPRYLSFAPIGSASAASPDQLTLVAMDAEPQALTFVRHERASPTTMPSLRRASPSMRPRPLRRAGQRGAPPGPAPADQPAHRRRACRLLPRRLLHAHRHPPGRGRAADQGRPRAGRPRQQGRQRAQGAVHHRHPARGPRGQSARAGRPRAASAPARQARRRPAEHDADRAHLARAISPTATRRRPTSIDELVRRVDIVPPSMAIAQGGVESGWGTSFAARTGNALFGQIQSVGRHSRRRAVEAGQRHAAAFLQCRRGGRGLHHQPQHPSRLCRASAPPAPRCASAASTPEGYRLIGTLLRYSERGQQYVQFVRQIMRENELTTSTGRGCRSFLNAYIIGRGRSASQTSG